MTQASRESLEATLAPDQTLPPQAPTIPDTVSTADTIAGPGRPRKASEPEPGTIIGRYVVLAKLGAGAMGVVLAAYDPELDRKVAIKLLRLRSQDRAAARVRLQREAQALAKLDHPHVVAVYDVGIHEDQLFVAMEFIAGQTLGEWFAGARPHPWREVVRVFVDAGRGLAAAHEAGLVHRDFKPDNVMLGAAGRVRVMDFGLARAADPEGNATQGGVSLESLEALTSSQAWSSQLTQTGTLMGTPAYMSPEQYRGGPIDARSDQFGFCVALYEGLYGERPFAGATATQLAYEVLRGHIADAPADTRVPSWLRRVVLRGLSTDAEQRFGSMTALLDALGHDPDAARRTRLLTLGGLVGVGVALAFGVWGLLEVTRPDAPACAGMEQGLVGVWDQQRRAEVGAAIEATGLSYAGATRVRVERALDDYSQRWVRARVDACEATQQGEQSGELLDLRVACLDERLQHLRLSVDLLAAADDEMVEKATEALSNLPALERCDDAEALRAAIPPPEHPDEAAAARAIEARLVEARVLRAAGKYEAGLKLVDAQVLEAEALGYMPLMIRAWIEQGILLDVTSDYVRARELFERAYAEAIAAGMTDEAASASMYLVTVIGVRLAQHEDARRWAVHAEPFSRADGSEGARAAYLNAMGSVAKDEGKYAESRRLYEQVLASRERALGPDHLSVAHALHNLAALARIEGRYAEAQTLGERSLAIKREVLGPGHPDIAYALTTLGNVARARGHLDEARDYHQRAVASFESSLGSQHAHVASALNNLGNVEAVAGNYAQARAHHQRALAIREQGLGPEHPHVADSLNNLGQLAELEGELEQGRALIERALAIREVALGSEHPKLASTLVDLAKLQRAQGQLAQAQAGYERALQIYAAIELGDHPSVADAQTGLGATLFELERIEDALTQLERALVIREAHADEVEQLANTRWVLARVLWAASASSGRDRPRALELAGLARVGYAGLDGGGQGELAAIDAWLAEHGPEQGDAVGSADDQHFDDDGRATLGLR